MDRDGKIAARWCFWPDRATAQTSWPTSSPPVCPTSSWWLRVLSHAWRWPDGERVEPDWFPPSAKSCLSPSFSRYSAIWAHVGGPPSSARRHWKQLTGFPRIGCHQSTTMETVALLASLRPAVIVVHGTRIIAERVLNSAGCPVVNMHAGITPRYRGVHGGYWALAEQHPDWVGTTVHLVDPGIDTGGILAQSTFQVTGEDTIATYPDLHLVHGLPLLAAQIDKVMAGTALNPLPASVAPGSGLYYHPTIWGYLWGRWRRGIR